MGVSMSIAQIAKLPEKEMLDAVKNSKDGMFTVYNYSPYSYTYHDKYHNITNYLLETGKISKCIYLLKNAPDASSYVRNSLTAKHVLNILNVAIKYNRLSVIDYLFANYKDHIVQNVKNIQFKNVVCRGHINGCNCQIPNATKTFEHLLQRFQDLKLDNKTNKLFDCSSEMYIGLTEMEHIQYFSDVLDLIAKYSFVDLINKDVFSEHLKHYFQWSKLAVLKSKQWS